MLAHAAAWLPLLLFLCTGWHTALALVSVPVRNVSVDLGENVTLICSNGGGSQNLGETNKVIWIRKGREDGQSKRLTVEPNGVLKLINVSRFDTGDYYCTLDDDAVKDRINVQVRTPPPALHNVWVKPSTILANILWEVAGTGGYPIIDFTAEYRLKPSPGEEPEAWKPIIPTHIPPNSRQIDVYHLEPNTTYSFRVWATNQLGRGEIVEVEGHTHHSVEELELARHLLAGVENFDTRVWVAAVGIVMGTLMVLGFGTCYLLYRECKAPCKHLLVIFLKKLMLLLYLFDNSLFLLLIPKYAGQLGILCIDYFELTVLTKSLRFLFIECKSVAGTSLAGL